MARGDFRYYSRDFFGGGILVHFAAAETSVPSSNKYVARTGKLIFVLEYQVEYDIKYEHLPTTHHGFEALVQVFSDPISRQHKLHT